MGNAIAVAGVAMAEKDNRKASRTRRQRGYQWEDAIVKRFNSAGNWRAFRLGSPTTGLPDVLAVSTARKAMFAIEAKSGTATSLPVPADQIRRCQDWIDTFGLYRRRRVVLAFKFLSKKRLGIGVYESRELREFFKAWDGGRPPADCYCTYEGRVFTRVDGEKTELDLEDQEMPFETRRPAARRSK